ncbi:MAG: hypothetical protein NT091_02655 [Candidatus Falkowbacteria bacterium]|nr:hypothetical protein [Candidatus Falkowbacteria bacterium]
MPIKIKLIIKYVSFFVFILAISFLIKPNISYSAKVSSDAVAVKVIPNPNNYSALRWYDEQGFKGSPQEVVVDDYAGVRDGSTVYVDAANVVGTIMYTNIYVLAYNQEADNNTIQIFDKILESFKFNYEMTTDAGRCMPSSDVKLLNNPKLLSKYAKSCNSDSDCTNESVTTCAVSLHKCVDPDTLQYCIYDSECANSDYYLYCVSHKSTVVRDTKRLADLAEIKIALNNYKKNNGHYPILAAGTYLLNKTISTWPSWQETFAKELGLPMLPIDPINRLGPCNNGYTATSKNINANTCWDDINKVFADSDPDSSDIHLRPTDQVYMYVTDSKGLNYGM